MRLLDLFCGAGGAAMGYRRAGFDSILGVDHLWQPNYPFSFRRGDAFSFLGTVKPGQFDLIHASPPCQAYSRAQPLQGRSHPKLIEPLRDLLLAARTPYVIENVPGAPLQNPHVLCGLSFGLKVFRHRLFESNLALSASPPHIPHGQRRIGKDGFVCVAGHGDSGRCRVPGGHRHVAAWRRAMEIDWMTRDELAQAVPPAYTHWIGTLILAKLSDA